MPGLTEDGRIIVSASAFKLLYYVLIKIYKKTQPHTNVSLEMGRLAQVSVDYTLRSTGFVELPLLVSQRLRVLNSVLSVTSRASSKQVKE